MCGEGVTLPKQARTNVADKKVDEDGNVYISPQILGISPQPE
jgi:hypothetical protein